MHINFSNIRPKLTLILVIVTMIGSALVSYFWVRQNEPVIAELKVELMEKQNLIRDIWNEVEKKDIKGDILVLILLFGNKNDKDLPAIKRYYFSDILNVNPNATPLEILKDIHQEKQVKIEQINNLYYEESLTQNKLSMLERSNKLYSDLAFFLQIIGLMFIILRKEHHSGSEI